MTIQQKIKQNSTNLVSNLAGINSIEYTCTLDLLPVHPLQWRIFSHLHCKFLEGIIAHRLYGFDQAITIRIAMGDHCHCTHQSTGRFDPVLNICNLHNTVQHARPADESANFLCQVIRDSQNENLRWVLPSDTLPSYHLLLHRPKMYRSWKHTLLRIPVNQQSGFPTHKLKGSASTLFTLK